MNASARIPAIRGTVLPKAQIVKLERLRPAAQASSRPAEADYDAYELANVSMLAAALGTGIYMDTFL